MKKNIFVLISLLFILILVGCNGLSTSRNQNPDTGDDTDGFSFEIPLATQLLLGTVKLEETDHAINAEQAAELLPLWMALRSLSDSDTTAQGEIDALIAQIQDSMTTSQMQAIEEMGLTMLDFVSVAETLDLETGFGGRLGEISPEMQATREALRESGEFPGGGNFPGGGFPGIGQGPGSGQGPGGGFGGAEVDPSTRETAIAERGGVRGARLGINSDMLDAIIKFLEAKNQ